MKGIGFDVYLDTTTTACFIDFTKYAITVINSTIISCNIDPAIMLSIGTHYVSFEIDHISFTPQEFEFLVLPNEMRIESISMLDNRAMLMQGSSLYSNNSVCSFETNGVIYSTVP